MALPTLRFVAVQDADTIAAVAALAGKIWREYYPALIGAPQVEYMLARIQSAPAIEAQIRDEGFRYFLVEDEVGITVGYLAVVARDARLFLSKFYLEAGCRGRGYARPMMVFVEDLARSDGQSRLALTVNRRNVVALNAYRRLGFDIVGPVEIDIGGGFVMDDYRLEKVLGDAAELRDSPRG